MMTDIPDPYPEVWVLTPSCLDPAKGCELLPVWSGRHIGRYEIRETEPPVGWVESCLYRVFRLWKDEGRRERPPGLWVWPTTDLDMSADAWLWMPPDHPDKPYSSRPAFARWYDQVVREMRAAKSQGRLL